MPHGESWFSFLPFLEPLSHWMSEAFGPSYMEHNSHLGVQHVLAYGTVVFFLLLVGLYVSRKLKNPSDHILPEGKVSFYGFIEMIVGATYKLSADLMGPKPAKYFLPLIGTCAFVILLSNFLGLVPGFTPPTDSLNTTVAMSLVIFFATHIFGIKENGLAYLKHFLGPVLFLAPLFLVIELISNLARPLSLSIRLMANMFADHQVLSQVSGLVKWVVPVAPMMLGSLVCIVQTLVFCILSTVYIAMAVAHHEHEEAHH